MQLNYAEINRRALDLLLSTKKHLLSIDPSLKALLELRVSQINGCAYCVDLHSQEARELGLHQQMLDCLPVWSESQLFAKDQMAALAWAESVTHISDAPNIDEQLIELLDTYSEQQVVDLTFTIAVMNGLNRLAISLGDKPSKRDA